MGGIVCLGNAVHDFVFSVETLPSTAGKHRASRFEAFGGGPAATAAVTIQRLGGEAALLTRLGDDFVADVIVRELEAYGVDCAGVRRFERCQSSVSAVMLEPNGERTIVNYLDADLPTDPSWLPDLKALGARGVLADTRWPAGAEALLERAQTAGLFGVLDADMPVPKDGALLRAASHVAFSKTGLADFIGFDDPPRALEKVSNTWDTWFCVTLGEHGTLVAQNGVSHVHPAFRVQAVDTLGAGDVWHGAFALALSEGQSEKDAVTFASAAAALRVTRTGGRAAIPTRDELTALIEKGPS